MKEGNSYRHTSVQAREREGKHRRVVHKTWTYKILSKEMHTLKIPIAKIG
jgi:hypothetical protein